MHVAAGGVLLRPDADRVLRDGVEGPQQLAVVGVVRLDEAADAVFAAVCADQNLAVDGRRRHRLAVAFFRIGDVGGPHRLAGLGVERHQLGVERRQIDLVAIDGDAAVVRAAAIGRDRPHVVLVVPQLLAGLGVERVDVAERRGDVHHAVDDDRRGFHQLLDLGLENPGRMQPLHVGAVDLVLGIETLLIIIAVGVQEILAVGVGAIEHVLRDIGRRRGTARRPCALRGLLRAHKTYS